MSLFEEYLAQRSGSIQDDRHSDHHSDHVDNWVDEGSEPYGHSGHCDSYADYEPQLSINMKDILKPTMFTTGRLFYYKRRPCAYE